GGGRGCAGTGSAWRAPARRSSPPPGASRLAPAVHDQANPGIVALGEHPPRPGRLAREPVAVLDPPALLLDPGRQAVRAEADPGRPRGAGAAHPIGHGPERDRPAK